ncbi:MAG: hypothetical protein E7553_00915 [Ruminococcaceae bacterium]|nr:hypothetical protein [Oscillospiraceae bacterium]
MRHIFPILLCILFLIGCQSVASSVNNPDERLQTSFVQQYYEAKRDSGETQLYTVAGTLGTNISCTVTQELLDIMKIESWQPIDPDIDGQSEEWVLKHTLAHGDDGSRVYLYIGKTNSCIARYQTKTSETDGVAVESEEFDTAVYFLLPQSAENELATAMIDYAADA